MKFKSNIGLEAGIEDNNNLTGDSGQVLSSTGSGVAWIDQNAITSSSDFIFFNVKNETGSTILKGKGIMAVGTDGNSGNILVDEMVADGTVEPKYFLGVLEEDIPNGGFARVISFGMLSQFDTRGQNGETWADGQILWCDPANPGDFTVTEPDGPNVKIAAAFILNSSTNGKIQIRVQANEGIHDLHDTKITSKVDGDVLAWNNTLGVWENSDSLTTEISARIAGDANLQGQIDALPSPNNATITITAGDAIDGGGTFTTDQANNANITLNHADTSTQGSVNNPTNTFIQDITLDTYGHITGLVSQAVTIPSPNNATITIAAGTNMSGGGDFTTDQSTNETITINHANTSGLNGTYGSTADGTKIDQITVDADGHVTAITTGATGDITGVTAGQGLTGGGTSGTVTLGVSLFGYAYNPGVIVLEEPPTGYDFAVGHGDTSTLNGTYGGIDFGTNTIERIFSIDFDEFGHTTSISTQAILAYGENGIQPLSIPPIGYDLAFTIDPQALSNNFLSLDNSIDVSFNSAGIGTINIQHSNTNSISSGSYGGFDPIIERQLYINGINIDNFGHITSVNTGIIEGYAGDGLLSLAVPPMGYDVAFEIDFEDLNSRYYERAYGLYGFNGDNNLNFYSVPPTGYAFAVDLAPRLKVAAIDFDWDKGNQANLSSLSFYSNVTTQYDFYGASGNADIIFFTMNEGSILCNSISENWQGEQLGLKYYSNIVGTHNFYTADYRGPLSIFGQGEEIQMTTAGGNNLIFRESNDYIYYGNYSIEVAPNPPGYNTNIYGNLEVFGNKNFRIDHPLKPQTHDLVHTVIESNRGDVIYRGHITLENGTASLNLDEYIGMSEGTFVLLTKDVQCFTTNESGWDLVKGSVTGNTLTVVSQNTNSTDVISWLVVGERKDEAFLNSSSTDENGKLILEVENEGLWQERIAKQKEEDKARELINTNQI